MLKQNIIKKNFEFQKIINLKTQIVSKYLIIYYKKNKNNLKVGISVSKKFGNAVLRNRQRRQVRAIMDKLNLYDELKYDAIIILRKEFITLNFETKKKQIKKMLLRIKNGK